jgi:hypothetical protein
MARLIDRFVMRWVRDHPDRVKRLARGTLFDWRLIRRRRSSFDIDTFKFFEAHTIKKGILRCLARRSRSRAGR